MTPSRFADWSDVQHTLWGIDSAPGLRSGGRSRRRVSPDTLSAAVRLAEQLEARSWPTPAQITATRDGLIQLIWAEGDLRTVLEVHSSLIGSIVVESRPGSLGRRTSLVLTALDDLPDGPFNVRPVETTDGEIISVSEWKKGTP